jgi:hypothetical protein
MGPGSLLKQAWEFVPILVLLLVGGAIAIPSGVTHLASRQDARKLAGNLTGILLRILGYVVVLSLLHYWIGLRPAWGW